MSEEQTTVNNFIKIAGVRFRENWKVYDFDASGIDLAVGDQVIVDSDRGAGFAKVVRIRKTEIPIGAAILAKPEPDPSELEIEIEEETQDEEGKNRPAKKPAPGPKVLRKVLRKATANDIAQEEKNRAREAEAFTVGQDMIAERELPMKLVRVEYSFDATRATFFFFSETRIDFRELVKDLAHKLKSRIEMRQIGVRDVARMIGGFGPCGRELCCSAFLKNFEPVSIRMAKKQEMVLNPAKISGVCGRLLCCLSYEYEMYDEIKKDLAGMRETQVQDKKQEEARQLEEQKQLAEERRHAEEKKKQEERHHEPRRRERQREEHRKPSGKPGERKEHQQAGKKQEPKPDQQKESRQQPKPEQRPQEQKSQQEQQEGEKSKKRRRRFWRRKKKGQQQGENKPQGPDTPKGA